MVTELGGDFGDEGEKLEVLEVRKGVHYGVLTCAQLREDNLYGV
jgi:hypothetical protein